MKKVFKLNKSKNFWLFILDIVLTLGIVVVMNLFLLAPEGEPDMFDRILNIIAIVALAIAVLFGIIQIIFSFYTNISVNENNFVESTRPINLKKFPKIKLKCEEIVNVELKCFFKTPNILTLKTQDNKFDVNLALFSKKQVLELLQEIQTRGGLQGKTIDQTIFK